MNEEQNNATDSGIGADSAAKVKWPAFVESSAVDFFIGYKLEMFIGTHFVNKTFTR